MTINEDQDKFSRLAMALRWVVLVQCVGLLWTSWVAGSAVESWLFSNAQWSDQNTFLLDRVVALSFVALATAGLFYRLPWAYLLMAAWFFSVSLARWSYGGAAFSDWAVAAHMVRWAAPLALVWLPSVQGRTTLVWFLRVAVATTFFVHGLEALKAHPAFVDYLLIAERRLLGGVFGLQQGGAESLLTVIGVVDIACAIALVVGRLRATLLLYMAFWGTLAAAARVVHSGEFGMHEMLIRAANGGVAFALWCALGGLPMRARASLADLVRTTPSFSRVTAPGVLAALALLSAVGFFVVRQTAAGQDGDLAPQQLRLIWGEAPAREARLSWTTIAQGAQHKVHYDTVSRGGVLADYASEFVAGRSGRYAGSGTPFFHHADLSGLEPSTTYWFVVESDGEVSEERYFVTAPADDRPFKLLYGGDSRSDSANRRRMNQRMATLMQDDPSILALGHGGDFVGDGGSWSQWDEWLDDHQESIGEDGRMLPVIPTRGNHEPDRTLYNRVFGSPGGDDVDYYVSHVGANLTLIVLDSNISHGGDQREWLEDQLFEAQSRRWIVPGYHRPAFPAVKTPGAALEHWVPLFEQYDVDLVCESDGHVLKRTLPVRDGKQSDDGIVYVGEGGLGVAQRTPIDAWYLDGDGMAMSAHHVQVLSFSPTELRYEAIALDGTVIDTYVAAPRRDGAPEPEPMEPDPMEPDPMEPEPADDAGVSVAPDAGMPPVDAGGHPAADPGHGGELRGTCSLRKGASTHKFYAGCLVAFGLFWSSSRRRYASNRLRG